MEINKVILKKYSKEFIKIYNNNEAASKVFENYDLFLIILSFFKSGWSYTSKKEFSHIIYWEDILRRRVEVYWVTDTMSNPFKHDGVLKKTADSSYYVGPVLNFMNRLK